MDAWLELALRIGPFLALLLGTWAIGGAVERRHFRQLRAREIRSRDFPLASTRDVPAGWQVLDCTLVCAGCVISLDYFKRFAAALRLLVGGRIPGYETLLDRARREAVLRMKESAHTAGYRAVVGMRLETSQVTAGRQRGTAGVEVIAWGTALKLAR